MDNIKQLEKDLEDAQQAFGNTYGGTNEPYRERLREELKAATRALEGAMAKKEVQGIGILRGGN